MVLFLPNIVWADDLYTNNIVGGCGDAYYYAAKFDPISYTCNSGYFLPAGAISCEECPDDYTCSGGTFVFNANQTQGIDDGDILVTNAIGSCSPQFNQSFSAIFEPNTININWDNGETITSNTCEYDGAITLPPEPTRVGYTFSGWRLKED